MRFKDSLKFALHNLTTRGLRSWLTIIGVIMGVAAIVAIVSVGQGMQQVISSQLGALGSDQVYVLPGGSISSNIMSGLGAKAPGELTDKDLKVIESVEGVIVAAPDIIGMETVSFMGDSNKFYIWGTNEQWVKVREASVSMESGRFLSEGDRGVAVLGYEAAKETFDKEVSLGSQIKIGNESYKVIGIMNSIGGLGGAQEDKAVFLSLEDAEKYSGVFGIDNYYAIEIKVEQERVEEIAEKIKEKLMNARHVTEDKIDFSVYTPKMIVSVVSSVLTTINLFLYGIAAISLIVGAVGIANTMFTSVTERTRQIGILKALGMTNKDVMNLFLVESALIGLVGGILGIFFGFLISGIIGQVASVFLASSRVGGVSMVYVSPELILFSLAFSVVIGIISGIFPARRAASLEPVEALRYE
ncbi:MAG: ABC transporter permease [Candidatus Pacearchaeota archaeon]|nr:ABC transporter permease [Candidatus Pacearchaeota archaeon]